MKSFPARFGILLVALPALLWSSLCAAEVKVGDVPPDYLGRDFDNQSVNVSQYKGRVLIVNFWATWCGPCRKEMGILNRVQHAANPASLGVVAVNFNEGEEMWKSMKRTLSVLDLKITRDNTDEVTRSYDVSSIPHIYMIDRNGRVAIIHQGYSEDAIPEFIGEIQALLKQPAAPAPVVPTED